MPGRDSSVVQASGAAASLAAEVELHAAQWWATLKGHDVAPETYDAWRQWHDGHAEHRRAWQQLIHAGTTPDGGLLPETLMETDTDTPDDQPSLRRQWLRRAAGFAAIGTGLWLARDLPIVQEWRADYRSATGEIMAMALPDGSAIVLNTASACNVRFDTVQRLVALVDGEIMITVAPDPDGEVHGAPRPLVIQTPQGHVTAVSARVSVCRLDDGVVVRVFEGSAAVRPTNAAAHMILRAGEQLRFGQGGTGPVGRVSPNADAWVRGTLVARDMPLGDFIAQLARYRTGWLHCDDAVAGCWFPGCIR